jgi:predicted RecA/RadA family phage recombinase
MASLVFSNPTTIQHTPVAALAAGAVVVVGSIVGVAAGLIAANTPGTLDISGEFEMPKAAGSSTAIPQGTKVYWDATNSVVTATASTHKAAGYTTIAASDDATSTRVALSRA